MPEEETTPVKRTRAPRKRAASSDAPPQRAPRRTVARKATTTRTAKKTAVEPKVLETPTVAATRKAPTPLATDRIEKKTRKKQLLIASAVLLFGIGASAAVGFTDAGRIDVNKTIEARNDRITSSGDNPTGEVVVPVQNTSGQPNGGMRGRGVGTRNVVPPVPAEGATTSEATASTTETESASEESTDVEVTEDTTEDVSVE